MRTLSSILFASIATFCSAAEPPASTPEISSTLAKYEARLAAHETRMAALEARIAALERSLAAPKAPATRSVVESRITSDFDGFDLDKVFVLENGQIWRQTEPYIWIHIAVYPKVTIYPSGSGVMKMHVDGIERAVGVERLK